MHHPITMNDSATSTWNRMKFQILQPLCGCLIVLPLLAGCTSVPTRVPVPPELCAEAAVPGFADVRYTLSGPDRAKLDAILTSALDSAPAESTDISLLAISSGGERGAFAAGVLGGWTERGDRPDFRIVCGVSVGALIAPLAFVGPEMDGRMNDAVVRARSRDTFRMRSLFAMLTGDSLADSEPLARSLEKLIDHDVIAAVARGHLEGRRLFVITTEVDTGRAVIWDLGAIAANGRTDAPAMFRRVLLASAAVPVAYPPQYFEVEAAGRRFDEMHVDGGVMAQLMLPLPRVSAVKAQRPVRVWAIMNAKLDSEPTENRARLVPLAKRSMQLLLLNQARTDSDTLRRAARAGGCEFQLAYIPERFDMSKGRGEGLDPEFVQALYGLGRHRMLKGEAFHGSIPGLSEAGE